MASGGGTADRCIRFWSKYTHRTSKPYYFIFQLKIFMKILVDIVKHLNFVFLIDFGEVLGSFCNFLPWVWDLTAVMYLILEYTHRAINSISLHNGLVLNTFWRNILNFLNLKFSQECFHAVFCVNFIIMRRMKICIRNIKDFSNRFWKM